MEKPNSERVIDAAARLIGELCILREYMEVMDTSSLSELQLYHLDEIKRFIPLLPPHTEKEWLYIYVDSICRELMKD